MGKHGRRSTTNARGKVRKPARSASYGILQPIAPYTP